MPFINCSLYQSTSYAGAREMSIDTIDALMRLAYFRGHCRVLRRKHTGVLDTRLRVPASKCSNRRSYYIEFGKTVSIYETTDSPPPPNRMSTLRCTIISMYVLFYNYITNCMWSHHQDTATILYALTSRSLCSHHAAAESRWRMRLHVTLYVTFPHASWL
jgi:hypothetical protein